MVRIVFFFAVFLFAQSLAFAQQTPDFLIIGTQKGGTTSLYAYLCEHPNCLQSRLNRTRPLRRKEVHFFNKNYDKGINWYLDLFTKKSHPNQIVGEASPSYIYDVHTPARVHEHFPNIKFIVLLRNPVERAFSAHQMYKRRRKENKTFDQVIAEELSLIKNCKTQNELDNILKKDLLISNGVYLPQLKRWLNYFKKDQILILKSEDFFEDPAKTMSKVYAFLGIPPHDIKNYPIFNEGNKTKEISVKTREKLSKFFKPYNEALQSYLTNELKLDLILNWN